ncbi:MAG: DNA methyltransferase [Planctomycetota bacterium]
MRLMTTTLWAYPSQHYDGRSTEQGDKTYAGGTPSWVIWQLLTRYTREGDAVLDPMCGGGTTIDVCADLGRTPLGFDLAPSRPDIRQSDARSLPLDAGSADFVFLDPPYSTHIEYSDDPNCIGKLDAAGDDGGEAYYAAMDAVFGEVDRVLKDRRYLAVYISDSWRKQRGGPKGSGGGVFMPIGFELFALLRKRFRPIDVVCVVRRNAKLKQGQRHQAAAKDNFFIRGFNYLLIFKKER